jgi:hypothetical protein
VIRRRGVTMRASIDKALSRGNQAFRRLAENPWCYTETDSVRFLPRDSMPHTAGGRQVPVVAGSQEVGLRKGGC